MEGFTAVFSPKKLSLMAVLEQLSLVTSSLPEDLLSRYLQCHLHLLELLNVLASSEPALVVVTTEGKNTFGPGLVLRPLNSVVIFLDAQVAPQTKGL